MTDCKTYSQRGIETERFLESLRLLQKFLTERTPLRVHFVSRSGNVSASVSGVLLELPPDSLMVGSGAPDGALLSFRVGADCEFEYGHGREAPESLPESVEARFESCVTLLYPKPSTLPDAIERVYLLEVKAE